MPLYGGRLTHGMSRLSKLHYSQKNLPPRVASRLGHLCISQSLHTPHTAPWNRPIRFTGSTIHIERHE